MRNSGFVMLAAVLASVGEGVSGERVDSRATDDPVPRIATACERFSGEPDALLIDAEDWEFGKASNVAFGNHAADPGFAPSKPGDVESLRVRLVTDSHYGASGSYYLPDRTTEAWVSFCMRFASDWTPTIASKLPGFAGDSSATNGGQGGSPSAGDNAWSARMMSGPFDDARSGVPLGFYIYHSGYSESSLYGDLDWWAPLPNRLLAESAVAHPDRWYAVRQHIRLNSPGKADGLLEAWIDGERIYRREKLHFTDNEAFREVTRFWLDVYHGGSEVATHDQHVYFDQIRVSTQ